jgi:hypothetical protein
VGSIGRTQVVWLIGARVPETILASGSNKPHQQAGHMDASDPIRPSNLLCHGGRPHKGPVPVPPVASGHALLQLKSARFDGYYLASRLLVAMW